MFQIGHLQQHLSLLGKFVAGDIHAVDGAGDGGGDPGLGVDLLRGSKSCLGIG